MRWRPGLRPGPRWGAHDAPSDSIVGWGGRHPSPIPLGAFAAQLLCPQCKILTTALSGSGAVDVSHGRLCVAVIEAQSSASCSTTWGSSAWTRITSRSVTSYTCGVFSPTRKSYRKSPSRGGLTSRYCFRLSALQGGKCPGRIVTEFNIHLFKIHKIIRLHIVRHLVCMSNHWTLLRGGWKLAVCSGLTRVGVTRGGKTDGCRPIFSSKNLTTFFIQLSHKN